METGHENLIDAIHKMHGCQSQWIESIPVKETFQDQIVWEGIVQVFELIDHPTAKKCYAWSYKTDSGKRKFVAVLHQEPVVSAPDAVKAAIVAAERNR